MARGVNKVILIGNLGADPEVRYAPSGSAIANVNVATSSSWRDKTSGEMVERTEWHRVVFFGRLAEIVAEYLRKGSRMYLEGSLRTRKWQDKSGQDRYTTEIVGSEMQMLDSRNGGGNGGNFGGGSSSQSNSNFGGQQQSSGAGNQQFGGQPASDTSAAPASDNFDDDIPF